MTQFLSISLLPLLLAFAGVGDALTFRIPNWLTGLIAVAFLPMAVMTGMPGELLIWHLAAGIFVLILGFSLFALGLFGGGDAKLLASTALWFGWPSSLAFVTYTVLAGGLLAMVVAIYSAFQIEGEARASGWIRKWLTLRPNVPYGLAIAAGAIVAFPQSWWMQLPHS